MRCKVGDLAVIVKTNCDKEHIGKIVKCVHLAGGYEVPCWRTDPDLKGIDGSFIDWMDESLQPIQNQPGQDETLTWLDVPSKEIA